MVHGGRRADVAGRGSQGTIGVDVGTHQRVDLVEGLELRRRRMHRRHDDAPAALSNTARPVSAWLGLALLPLMSSMC